MCLRHYGFIFLHTPRFGAVFFIFTKMELPDSARFCQIPPCNSEARKRGDSKRGDSEFGLFDILDFSGKHLILV